MLMSQGARSADVIGCPNRGASAALATFTPSASAAAKASFSCTDFVRIDFVRIDSAHLAPGIDSPARDGVEVLHRKRGHIRRTPGRTALGNERFARRLHVVFRPAVWVYPHRYYSGALLFPLQA